MKKTFGLVAILCLVCASSAWAQQQDQRNTINDVFDIGYAGFGAYVTASGANMMPSTVARREAAGGRIGWFTRDQIDHIVDRVMENIERGSREIIVRGDIEPESVMVRGQKPVETIRYKFKGNTRPEIATEVWKLIAPTDPRGFRATKFKIRKTSFLLPQALIASGTFLFGAAGAEAYVRNVSDPAEADRLKKEFLSLGHHTSAETRESDADHSSAKGLNP